MRALVLSGGAVHGAYECGAIQYLVNDLGLQYDILCGVSVGALNCGYLSLYPKEQEKEAVANLTAIWSGLDNSKVRENWLPLFYLHALWLDSVYNSQPLIDLVHSTMDLNKVRASGRKVAVGAVSATTGNYRSFTQDDDSFIDGILASSSYPMGLCPIVIDGEKYTDGGVKHITPLQEAIDFGATDIDIIICSPVQTTASFNDVDTIAFGMRCFDLMTDQMQASDLKVFELYNQLAAAGLAPGKRYINYKIIRPTQDLQLNPLSFDTATIKSLILQGYSEAKEQYK